MTIDKNVKSIQNVSLIGLGAEGSVAYYALRKTLKSEQVAVIADGDRKARLEREGIIINDREYDLTIREAGTGEIKPDIIIVSVKDYQLEGTFQAIEKELGPNTAIMSLLNGISSEDVLAERFGQDRIVYSVSRINAKKQGNRVEFTPYGQVMVGEKDRVITERVKLICELFEAGVPSEISEDICLDIWRKYLFNSACNTVEAIFRGNHKWFQRIPEACDAMECIMEEIVALAQKMGIALTEQDIRNLDGVFMNYAAEGMCSMAQDMVAERQTEIDLFMGEALRLGRKHGVKMPVCRFVYDIIKSMDKVNQGILD